MAKSKDQKNYRRKVTATVIIAAIIIGIGVYFVTDKILYYRDLVLQSSPISLRELILQTAEETKTNAPIDPRTGDIYFPQARLYLPNSSAATNLTYTVDTESDTKNELSISNKAVFRQNAAKLYSAKSTEEVMQNVPKLQSCQRGIKLLSSVSKDENLVLKETLRLDTGKILYVYIEKDCPELLETVDLLKNLKPY